MKNSIIILSVLFLGCFAFSVNAQSINKKEKAVHIVLFKFKEGTTSEQIQSLKKEILKQKSIFPGILEISFGKDFTSRSKGFGYAEVAVFKNRKSLEDFNKSDYHQQLIATHIRPILDDILVLDYENKNDKN
ncbi:Dabb family protein [Chryseobacterium oranimense]|uniref:Dabb family protein n=1 Tax=Chryseobacterium oranimense TaxID=421058 RepID=UPI002235E35D|nr:Dabb family protein [Chryseobacterium oranimense]